MGMKCEGDTITCDCGFSFQRGQSGKHECADGLRVKLASAVRREESLKASVDVMGKRIAELEQHMETDSAIKQHMAETIKELERRLQQPIPEALVDTVCHTAAEIYRAHDEDKAQDIINRIRDELQAFKVEGE